MGATYVVFSPRPPPEMLAIEAELEQAFAEYLDEHPDAAEDLGGEMSAGGLLPTREEVEEAYRRYRLALEPAVLARLVTCRSALGGRGAARAAGR